MVGVQRLSRPQDELEGEQGARGAFDEGRSLPLSAFTLKLGHSAEFAGQAGLRANTKITLGIIVVTIKSCHPVMIIGSKALRVFDSWVVVVMVRAWVDETPLQLLGAYPCPDEDTPRGAVMAVLDATNRVLQSYLST